MQINNYLSIFTRDSDISYIFKIRFFRVLQLVYNNKYSYNKNNINHTISNYIIRCILKKILILLLYCT